MQRTKGKVKARQKAAKNPVTKGQVRKQAKGIVKDRKSGYASSVSKVAKNKYSGVSKTKARAKARKVVDARKTGVKTATTSLKKKKAEK